MALDFDKSRLIRIFGEVPSAVTEEDFARSSMREFVRSQDHLAFSTPKATGQRLTAWQAYQAFGLDKLEEVIEHSSAVLTLDPLEPAQTLRRSREARGLELDDIADAIGVSHSDVANAENPKHITPIQLLNKIAASLGVEESTLTARAATASDERLAYRLRQMKTSKPDFTPRTVISFDEAAWVIQKQEILAEWLGNRVDLKELGFAEDSRYGDKHYPAWQLGYDLAHATRNRLGIKQGEPIDKLRDLVEVQLKIPLVHLELSNQFAGATIAIGPTRGIAVNINGLNKNDWVRRATIAHELGHLLWDPDQNLRSLVVDTFDEIEDNPLQQKHDWVEARANAFAIEFLAPREYALEVYNSTTDKETALRNVMVHFGVSFISARFQIWNALERSVALESFRVSDVEPTPDWKGRESFTNDFFVPDDVPVSRRGYFALYVVEAMKKRLISVDSAASYLQISNEEVQSNAASIRDLFRKTNVAN
ncbi:MAG: XRE family transcriptional regulator [Xanthobacteraceae bacterium]